MEIEKKNPSEEETDEFEIVVDDDDAEDNPLDPPEIVDDLFTAPKEEVVIAPEKETEDKVEFGKRAEKRIKALLAKTKSLENQLAQNEQAATRTQQEQVGQQAVHYDEQLARMETRESELKSLETSINTAYKSARENNDIDAEIAANDARTQISGERSAIENAKRYIKQQKENPAWEQARRKNPTQTPIEQYDHEGKIPVQQAPTPDPDAFKWWKENSWFRGESNADKIKTFRAQQIHMDLVNEGIDPSADGTDYYTELNSRLREDFPELGKNVSKQKTGSPVSGGGRANPQGDQKGKIKITQSMFDYCERNGIDPKKYALEVKKLRDSGREI